MRKLTHAEIGIHRLDTTHPELQLRMPIYALLDNIRSLYNVGSVFRSSDGARLKKLYLTGYTPYPPRREIDKTALGSTQTVPWSYFKDPMEAVTELKSTGVKLCALELTDTSKPYFEIVPGDFPLCLVVGNEISGISKSLLDAADFSVEIPMIGYKQSLNVAVAYGIVLYDLLRVCLQSGIHPTQE